jgi:hypothetical protein
MRKRLIFAFIYMLWSGLLSAQPNTSSSSFTIARIKYHGGGDWYCDPSSLPNLLKYIKDHTAMDVTAEEARVELTDEHIFSFPYLYMTGHGNVRFTDKEVVMLRRYLTGGGFLHADDCYGMDKSFRREMKKVFPEQDLIELPFSHGIYSILFKFPEGVPKIHEHDGGPAHGYGIFYKNRLVVYYSFNTDLGDGWEDPDVHKDPEEKRVAALQMGTNIVLWALSH